jgi:hypothetical protein
MTDNSSQDLLSRLDRLEAQNARFRKLLWVSPIAVLIAALTGVLASWQVPRAEAGEDKLRCKQFVVEDDTGNPRIALQVTRTGPSISFFDSKKDVRFSLYCDDNGDGKLGFRDADGKVRATVGLTKQMPSLFLYDANGKVRAAVYSLAKDGAPGVQLFDEEGKVTKQLP